ncbi:hypothetical protein C0995_011743 [Termitomyces sp. Mi166|nr:hypothetical protein C0995_011743 [Termitomyces sp. Mi166\
MVEPKQARAPSQHPQKLAWVLVRTVARLLPQPLKLASGASTSRSIHMDPAPVHQMQEPDIPAEPMAELSLEASDQIMSDASAVQQEQRTLEQYDGLVATQQKAAAASKGKGKIVPTLSDKSDYGESLSEHERESEKGESAAQHFQRVQYNKKLTAKKAYKAKAEAALQHRAINDFSGHIPNGLGVKVWGPLDVERLNLCFTGALSNCMYYSVHNNAIFVGANANWAAAFEYSSQQRAKMPVSLVYKFAPHGFLRTPYELERLYKHYANKHAPHHD